jgi:hypothetical protein
MRNSGGKEKWNQSLCPQLVSVAFGLAANSLNFGRKINICSVVRRMRPSYLTPCWPLEDLLQSRGGNYNQDVAAAAAAELFQSREAVGKGERG